MLILLRSKLAQWGMSATCIQPRQESRMATPRGLQALSPNIRIVLMIQNPGQEQSLRPQASQCPCMGFQTNWATQPSSCVGETQGKMHQGREATESHSMIILPDSVRDGMINKTIAHTCNHIDYVSVFFHIWSLFLLTMATVPSLTCSSSENKSPHPGIFNSSIPVRVSLMR